MSIWKGFVALFRRDINARNKDGLTQLHIAVKSGDKELAESLVLKGADVKALTSDNKTPLFIAAVAGHSDIVQFLLSKGADINAGQGSGFARHDDSITRRSGKGSRVCCKSPSRRRSVTKRSETNHEEDYQAHQSRQQECVP